MSERLASLPGCLPAKYWGVIWTSTNTSSNCSGQCSDANPLPWKVLLPQALFPGLHRETVSFKLRGEKRQTLLTAMNLQLMNSAGHSATELP